MRNQRTEHAYVARTCDLDDVGIEVLHPSGHFPIMPPEREVIFVRPVEWKGEWTTGKLDPGYGTRSHDLLAWTCVDGQKLKFAVFRKCFEMSARVGNAVHFVVRIRKERDS
jgi:hypothetical protein